MVFQKRYIYLLAIILLTSCSNFSEITIGEIKDLTFNGFEDNALLVGLSVHVDNPTHQKITITDIDFKVYMKNQYLGKANLTKPIILPANSSRNYNIDLKVRVANIFGSALTLMNLKNGQTISFKMQGTINARTMLLKKNIDVLVERKIII